MAKAPEELAHLEWLGYVQPVGLVVSVPALLEAQCYINKNISGEHKRFLDFLSRNDKDEIDPAISDFSAFVCHCLGWEAQDIKEISRNVPLPDSTASLEVILPQYHETLRPTHAVPIFKPKEDETPWQMLIQVLPAGTDFDKPSEADSSRHWQAAPQLKFERLLRETAVSTGLLCNGGQLRLVYAPRGESSGHATFNVAEMVQVAGRPMFAALHMLLSADRMFTLPDKQRLPAILENSRKYQNTVSTKLAEQVLAALYELMRGFQAANDVREGELLREVLANDPNHVYSGLLTVLMRLVFVLYAEDRDLMSSDPIYSNNYSITGLFERLREDKGRFPDTMEQRFGAWSQLLTLFRLVFEGGQHGTFKLPARKGYLFDPDRYPFLEGRQRNADPTAPSAPVTRISDGVVYNVLRNLLILDGERLSYRTLDVEQIGSVYETVMGFNLEVARGKSIAIKSVKTHGAPATINLEALLATEGKERAKWLKEQSDQTLGKDAVDLLNEAITIEQLLEALDKKIAKKVTPRIVPASAIVLQPSDERRRSGSHYTPRSLTEPIVRTTLEPILKALADPTADLSAVYEPSREDKQRYTKGELDARIRQSEKAVEYARLAREVGAPHPSQILDLKICDPAMGSGAFLVEACRQLGDKLIEAWHAHDLLPTDIPPDEDEVLYARRLVAQRCLYGVDKNPMAVDLAKLSLWLVTLAKGHPFTFLDHSLRHGDSLVGLTRKQIIRFHWESSQRRLGDEDLIQKRLDRATEARAKILNAREDVPYRDQERRLAEADETLNVFRLTGDACISAFFAGSKKKEREDRCDELFASVNDWYASGHDPAKRASVAAAAASLRSGERPVPPFHWEIEFPEVFARDGFDAFVGNPPFLGGRKIRAALGDRFCDWITETNDAMSLNADLVALFYRTAFERLRPQGVFGLIATNTIAQGDTRNSGLRWICKMGGTIYAATKRLKWPGEAAVVVSVVYVGRGKMPPPFLLDGREVGQITAFLFHAGGHEDPAKLQANNGKSFNGSVVLGMGFTFDDNASDGVATPIDDMQRLVAQDSKNADRIFPFLGGEEVNTSPTQHHHRYIINFGDFGEDEARTRWPDLMRIVEAKVKPSRTRKDRRGNFVLREPLPTRWWQYADKRPALYKAIDGLSRILVINCGATPHMSFAFVPPKQVFAHSLSVFPLTTFSAFAALQSRPHEVWVRFFASSMKDDLRYTASDCFETFPFPRGLFQATDEAAEADQYEHMPSLEATGKAYYDYRAELMVKNNEGLTKTYNRFHDPHERSSEILHLRQLHAAMDRAVLEAYGWCDVAAAARCEFLLDYEEEDDDEPGAKKSNKKKPWRLRWPDDFRDEVLARLLELNEKRAKEEKLAGKTAAAAEAKRSSGSNNRSRKSSMKEQQDLFKK